MTVLYLRCLAAKLSCPRFFRRHASSPLLLLLGLLALPGALSGRAQAPSEATRAELQRTYGQIPLSFEPNRGQAAAGVQFLSRGQGYSLYLTPAEALLELRKPSPAQGSKVPSHAATPEQVSSLAMKLIGADRSAPGTAQELLPGTTNYFIGNDRSKWQTALPNYKRVAYRGVYPGVDLVYYGNHRELEYDFVVAPGADAAKIQLEFTGATPHIDAAGDLVLTASLGETRFHKPVVYQFDGDRKVSVKGKYLIAEGRVGFALGAYDHSKTLVIDPVLSYLTYIGGSNDDTLTGMAVDTAGSVYVVGTTNSTDFPVKNAYKATDPNTIASGNPLTIFVSKLNAAGTALVYSTYLGSSEYSYGTSIAVDTAGNAYVGGYTPYGDYPVTAGAYQTLCGANNYYPQGSSTAVRINGCGGAGQGQQAGTLTKLDPTGTSLVYSTYLSGGNSSLITAVAVNAAGEAWVTGLTNAVCPGPYNANGSGYQSYFCIATTANASDQPNNLNSDTYAFVVKFNAKASALLYSTTVSNHNPQGHYVSGIAVKSIAIDPADNAYITGNMDLNYFIKTTPGSLQPVKVDPSLPAFVAKFNPTAANSLVYATYLSGTDRSNDTATGIAADSAGNAYITGYTNSCTFPTTPGALSTVPGGYVSANICYGGFLSKLNPAGSALVWSTFTATNGANGRNNDNSEAIALGPDGSVYVAGDEQGVALTPTVNPVLVQSESHFAYIKQFKPDGSAITFSSAIGGTTDATSIPSAIAVDAANNIYLAGYTNSATWPTTAGAFQKNSAGPNDGFIVKLAPTIATTTTLTLPTSVTAGQSATFTATVAGPTGTTKTPTGTVTFTSGSTTLGTGTLNASGTATYTASSLNATTYNVIASYPGDTTFASSVSAARSLVVTPATPTIALSAPATATPGSSVTLSVKVTGSGGTPTGSVTFKDGTTTLSTVTLASGAASYTTTAFTNGSHSLTATYTGDSIFAGATTSAQTLVIALLTPTITLTAPGTALVGASVTLSASVTGTSGTPTGSVLFKDGTTTLSTVTLSSGAASYTTTTLAAGAHTITASYSGDATFSAVTSSASTVTITVAPAVTFTASPSTLTVARGSTGTTMITGTPVGGYSGTATFACGTLPAGASCTFSPTSLVFTGTNVAASTTLTFGTATTVTGFVLPAAKGLGGVFVAGLLMPFALRRRRKTIAGKLLLWAMLLCGVLPLMAITGCGSSPKSITTTTAAGVYTVPVTVTAAGTQSTVNLSVTVQ